MKKIIIIRGLPGSGKSTIAGSLAKKINAIRLEADMFFEMDGKYTFEKDHIKQAHDWCRLWCELALSEGRSVIVANTFTKKWEMQDYFSIAAKHNASVEIVVASGNFKNVHGVPAEVIEQMRERWED